jgi:hypothetical protein
MLSGIDCRNYNNPKYDGSIMLLDITVLCQAMQQFNVLSYITFAITDVAAHLILLKKNLNV